MDHIETLSEILEHTETRCLLYEKRIRDGDAAAVHFLEVATRDAAALTYAISVVEAAKVWCDSRLTDPTAIAPDEADLINAVADIEDTEEATP